MAQRNTNISPGETILRRRKLQSKLSLSASSIYGKLKFNPNRPNEYDPSFPKPVRLGPRAVGWLESEVDAWIESRIAASREVR